MVSFRCAATIRLNNFEFSRFFPDSVRAVSARAHRNITVDEAIRNGLAARTLATSTFRGYSIKHDQMVSPSIGDSILRTVRKSDVEKLISQWSNTYATKTINDAMVVLRSGFQWALDQGVVSSDVTSSIHNQSPGDSEAKPFQLDDLAKLLAVCEPHFRNMVKFWVATGLRPSEVRALRWEDVDFSRERLFICRSFVLTELKATKTKKHRVVKLGKSTIDVLKNQMALSGDLSHGFVFTKHHNDEPWHGKTDLFCALRERCIKAGIKPRSPNQLRHTYASIALSAGESPYFVMTQLGHKDLTVLRKTYARWMDDANPMAGTATESVLAANYLV